MISLVFEGDAGPRKLPHMSVRKIGDFEAQKWPYACPEIGDFESKRS